MRRQYPVKFNFHALPGRLGRDVNILLLMIVGLFCLSVYVNGAHADDASIEIIGNGLLGGNLVMQFQAEEVFTEKVIRFLTRGFTVRIEYTVELWRSRKWWFDHLDSQHNIRYQIDFQPLEKRYICRASRQRQAVASRVERKLGSIIQWTTQPELPLIITPAARLDSKSSYYYDVTISVATLTAKNISDLRRWIEYGSEEKETSTLTETSFKLAKDAISASHRKRLSMQSEKFRLRDLPRFDN